MEAKKYLPGGDTRDSIFYTPYPIFIKSAQGFELRDLDNNAYTDFMNNYTVQVHGHNHPKVLEAVLKQIPIVTLPGAPTESQFILAKIICNRVKSVEKIRFCNSGSEATMMAVRAALAYTGKKKILKMEGGYHGIADFAKVSPPGLNLSKAGDIHRPDPVLSNGIFAGIVEDVLVTQYNDIEAAEHIINKHKGGLAAVIVEPVLGAGGMIPAYKEYLKSLRELTISVNALLIFDEVITFRLSKGGAQSIYGVTPDMTAFGKIIGGGYPVGAFGGRDEIMSLFDPSIPDKSKYVSHAGTFNANPITCTAGIANLKLLVEEAIQKINKFGDNLRAKISEVFLANRIKGQVTGIGSLGNIHFTSNKVVNYRGFATADRMILDFLHLSLLNRGIFIARRGMFNTSTPMSKGQVKSFITALEDSLTEIRPIIEKHGLLS